MVAAAVPADCLALGFILGGNLCMRRSSWTIGRFCTPAAAALASRSRIGCMQG